MICDIKDLDVELGCAMHYINSMFRRIYGTRPIWKYEDYEITFRVPELWLPNIHQQETFAKLVMKCINKFPLAAHRIIFGAIKVLPLSGASTSCFTNWAVGYLMCYLEHIEDPALEEEYYTLEEGLQKVQDDLNNLLLEHHDEGDQDEE